MRAMYVRFSRRGRSSLGPLGRGEIGMRYSHVFKTGGMMTALLGFAIALVVGLTGMGGGTFTTPALVLLIGLPAGEAVGTAMIFAAVLRIFAAPFYLLRKQVHGKYLWPLLLGAVPGLLFGTWLLHRMGTGSNTPLF